MIYIVLALLAILAFTALVIVIEEFLTKKAFKERPREIRSKSTVSLRKRPRRRSIKRVK